MVRHGRASKRYVCRMAEEVRAAVKANPDVYERLLELNEDLLLYVNSAAVLYGYVTYKEICDLYCRWNDDGLVDEQMVELVAEDGLEFEPEYLIHHGEQHSTAYEQWLDARRTVCQFIRSERQCSFRPDASDGRA